MRANRTIRCSILTKTVPLTLQIKETSQKMFFISVVSFTAVFGGRLWEFRLKSFRAVWSLRRRLTFTNILKANANPPINPKKYSCYGLRKIHTRNLITKKIRLENSPSKFPNIVIENVVHNFHSKYNARRKEEGGLLVKYYLLLLLLLLLSLSLSLSRNI